jgi:hypothetical protein
MMLSFWNHGGGPFSGVAFDENTDDYLSLSELQAILKALKDARGENLELLGFDTCLTNNIETAGMLAPYADYLIASEEIEPGEGWNYSWLSALNEAGAKETTLTPDAVGRAIVDTYALSINDEGDWSQVMDETLALVDLSRMEALETAFDHMAKGMLVAASDEERFAALSRTAEKVQHMCEGCGMLDLYDFANDISAIVPAAREVLGVLGAPSGTTADHYVGAAQGKNPCILYRGTGLSHNECLGMAFYYPTTKTDDGTGNSTVAAKYVQYYRGLEISDHYADYLTHAMVMSEQLRKFDGAMQVAYDEKNDCYTLQIVDPDDVLAIKTVDFLTVYTDITDTGEETSYLLGVTPVEEDWEQGLFSDRFDGCWYTMNDQLFTVSREVCNSEWEYCEIPAILEGDSTVSTLQAYHHLATEDNPQDYIYICSILTPTGNESAPRSTAPEGELKFYPLLRKFDPDTQMKTDYTQNDLVSITADDESGLYFLPVDEVELASGQNSLYTGYFHVTDLRNKTRLSEPNYYVIVNDLAQMSAEDIPAQRYTGQPVTPAVHLWFLGEEILTEGVHYSLAYSDNVKQGQATVTVTGLEEDLPGKLTLHFQIEDGARLAEQLIDALPAHLCGLCPDKEEQLNHLYAVDQAKTAMDWAVSAGILTGNHGRLNPKASVTRAQAAVMLMRYVSQQF